MREGTKDELSSWLDGDAVGRWEWVAQADGMSNVDGLRPE